MSSKLNFRARTLDASKPMTIFHVEDLPELADLNAINRSVPAMPSGMEKEEEAEKHLQDILEVQEQSYTAMKTPNLPELVIPTPDVYVTSDFDDIYRTMYKGQYKPPRQYIHVQPFNVDQDNPDYDLDDEDEDFLNRVLKDEKKFEVTAITFEDMLDRLEKNSGHNVVTIKEAKLLLKEDDDLIQAVFDYWVDKRLRLKQPLIPTVKSDKRDAAAQAAAANSASQASTSASSSPYIAFRRRTEKMQTRKNRKNDEASYEKMLKLRRDLSRAVTLLEMVKRREKTKKENLNLTVDVFEKRYQIQDWDGKLLSELLALRQAPLPLRQQPYNSKYAESWLNQHQHMNQRQQQGNLDRGQKRQYKKKRHKSSGGRGANAMGRSNGPEFGTMQQSSDDDRSLSNAASPSDVEEDEMEGPFAFKRKRHCQYLAPNVDQHGFDEPAGWPWESREEGGGGEARFRYSMASLSTPRARCVGMVRRRVGRGGRIVLDRAFEDHDSYWRSLDFTVLNGTGVGTPTVPNGGGNSLDVTPSVPGDSPDPTNPTSSSYEAVAPFEDWPHFRPVTPPLSKLEDGSWDPLKNKLQESSLPCGVGLPTQPVKPPQHQQQRSRTAGGVNGMRTLSVDSTIAQNAASAVVSGGMLDLYAASSSSSSMK